MSQSAKSEKLSKTKALRASLEMQKSELERAISLTDTAARYCGTPEIMEMHFEAIRNYNKRIKKIEQKLIKLDN